MCKDLQTANPALEQPVMIYEHTNPDTEPHRVLIARGVLIDEARDNRDIPYKIYYPVNHNLTGLPLVVWSHGLGGSADGAAFLSRFIASHGYVVLNVQHRGTDSSLWEGKPGHPWDIIRNTHIPRSASLDRFRDIPFVLDNLPRIAAAHPEAAQHWDSSRIGMSGHSFGALTTQVMAGQMFPGRDGELLRMPDKRFRAGILYSPVPIRHLSDAPDEEVYNPIELPLFYMTGTADQSPIEGFGYDLRLKVYEHSGAAEKHLLILEDGDHMVFAGSRGQLSSHPKRKIHEGIIKVAALAFWDMFLKDDPGARNWLTGGGFAQWLGDEAHYKGP